MTGPVRDWLAVGVRLLVASSLVATCLVTQPTDARDNSNTTDRPVAGSPVEAAAIEWSELTTPSGKRLRPIFVPTVPRSEWPAGDWTAVRVGDLRGEAATASSTYVSRLNFEGQLLGDTLSGSFQLEAERGTKKIEVLDLGPTSLAVWASKSTGTAAKKTKTADDANSQARPHAILGTDGQGHLRCLLPSRGAALPENARENEPVRTDVSGRWAASGLALYRARSFTLELPRAVTRTMRLRLPRELAVRCEEAVVRREAIGNEDDELRTWTLSFGRSSRVVISVEPGDSPASLVQKPAIEWQGSVLARIDETQIAWRTDLSVDALDAAAEAPQQVDIEFPEDCVVEEVTVGGIPQRPDTLLVEGRLVVSVRTGPLPASLSVRGRRATAATQRQIPQPAIRRSRVAGLRVVVECDPLLVVRDYDASQLRPVAASLRSQRGDRLEFEATGTRPRLTVRTGPPRARLRGRQLTAVDFAPLLTEVSTVVGLSTETGSAAQVELAFPEGWDWVDVRSLAGPEVLTWRVADQRGESVASIELAEPLTSGRGLRLLVRGVRRHIDEGTLELPTIRPLAADLSESHLVVVTPPGRRVVVEPLGAVTPMTPSELIDESLLAGDLPGPLSAPPDRLRRYRLEGPTTGRLRLLPRGEERTTPEQPIVLPSPGQPLAQLTVQTELAAGGQREHLHEATFRLHGEARTSLPRFRLSRTARLIGLELDGRPVQRFAGDDDWTQLLTADDDRPVVGDRLVVRYATRAGRGWLWRDSAIVRPELDCPVLSLDWTVAKTADDRISRAPLAGQATLAGLDELGWRERLFGPLGRPAGVPRATLATLLGQATPANRSTTFERQFSLETVDPPTRWRLATWSSRAARQLAWTAFATCVLTGLLLRRFTVRRRGTAASLWTPLCLVFGWFAPPALAAAGGAAAIGTLLGMLLPRSLIAPEPPPVDRDGNRPDDSTALLQPATTRGAAMAIAFALVAWHGAGSAIGQSGLPLSPGAVEDVLVPFSPSDELQPSTVVFVRRDVALELARRRSDRDLLLLSTVVEPREGERPGVAVRCDLMTGPACRGLWMPSRRGLTLVDDPQLDGRRLSAVPAAAGLFLPLPSDETGETGREPWTKRTLRLTYRLPQPGGDGFATLPLPTCHDVLAPVAIEVLPPSLQIEQRERGDTATGRRMPLAALSWRVAPPERGGLSLTVDAVVGIDALTGVLHAAATVRGGQPGQPAVLTLPGDLLVRSVSLEREDGTDTGDPNLPQTDLLLPTERRSDRTRVLLPADRDGQRRVRIVAELPGPTRGRRRSVPLAWEVREAEAGTRLTAVRLGVVALGDWPVTAASDDPLLITPLAASLAADVLDRVAAPDAWRSRPFELAEYIVPPDARSPRVVLSLEEPRADVDASVQETGRFLPSRLEWEVAAELQTTARLWRRSLEVDRRLLVESVEVLQDGVPVLDRWSRVRSSRDLTSRLTLLFEESVTGPLTLRLRGSMPLDDRRGGQYFPRFELVDATVSGRSLVLENLSGEVIELLDAGRRPWRADTDPVTAGSANAPRFETRSESRSETRGETLGSQRLELERLSSSGPAGFRVRSRTSAPTIESAAIINAVGQLDLIAVAQRDEPTIVRTELSLPPHDRLQTSLLEVERVANDRRVRLILLAGRPVRQVVATAEDVEWEGGVDPTRPPPLPEPLVDGRIPSRRYLAVALTSGLRSVAGRSLAVSELPAWLRERLPQPDRWQVVVADRPLQVTRRIEREPQAPDRLAHTVWPGSEATIGRSAFFFGTATATRPVAGGVDILGVLVDGRSGRLGEDAGGPLLRSGRRVELFWRFPHEQSPLDVRLPAVAADGPTPVGSLQLVGPPSGKLRVSSDLGQTIDEPAPTEFAAAGSQVTQTTLPSTEGPLMVQVRSEWLLPRGTGYFLAALMLYVLIAEAVRRSRWAARVPDLTARSPYLAATLLAVVWWWLLSPSEVGLAAALLAVALGVTRRIIGDSLTLGRPA